MRPSNFTQTLEQFEFLGHKPEKYMCCGSTILKTRCSICKSMLGTRNANNPCGDPKGTTLTRLDGFWSYKGKVYNE